MSEQFIEIDGKTYDLNNIPGSVKQKLVLEGKVKGSAFIAPPNMPGAKIAELRRQYDEEHGLVAKPEEDADDESTSDKVEGIPYTKGMEVKIGKHVVTIIAVNSKKGVKVKLPDKKTGMLKSKWVHFDKVSLPDRESEDV